MTNQLFINNEFIESQSKETMDVINPATGEAFDTITLATEEEVNDAIEKSQQAQLEWGACLNLHVRNMLNYLYLY